jgi:hypothetical protein
LNVVAPGNCPVVPDVLKLTFANGSTAELEAIDGEAALKDIIDKKGDYKVGWIKKDDRHWLNLDTVVELELELGSGRT